MSAKFLQAFADENADLQKQIGCMTGIFQMFDGHHLLTGRRLSGHSHKKLTSGHALLNSSSVEADRNACSPRIILGKNLSRSVNENQRVSMESSQTSFSSSSSSSFSSLEFNKSTQQAGPSTDRFFFPERKIKNSPKLKDSDVDTRPAHCEPSRHQLNASTEYGRQSLDFRDVVKDSIYRDTRALPVRTLIKEEVNNLVLKHRDSPRAMRLSKSIDEKSRMSADLNESLQVLMKLQEAPWYFSDANEPARSSYEAKGTSFHPITREAPRFSYDGREVSQSFLDAHEVRKPASKLRELPRLSLDSREGSLRSSNFSPKPNSVLKDLNRSNVNKRASTASHHQQELESYKRQPNVVAKLMGLDAMPNLSMASQEPTKLPETNMKGDHDYFTGQRYSNFITTTSKASQQTKQDQRSSSPGRNLKDPVMPRGRVPDSVMKSVSNSRVPIEAAPWRQPDRSPMPKRKAFRYRGTPAKQQPESVFSEMERRLKELESMQSNKDLRALKQILYAMQSKRLLENEKGHGQHSEVSVHQKSSNETPTVDDHSLDTSDRQNKQITHSLPMSVKGSNNLKASGSPIVIMKPAKTVKSSGVSSSSVIPLESLPSLRKLRTSDPVDKKKGSVNSSRTTDRTCKASPREPTYQPLLPKDRRSNNMTEEYSIQRTCGRIMQGSSRSQQSPRENSGSSVKSSSSVSPRLQQRKLEMEKRSRPPLPSSDSNKPQRLRPGRQSLNSISPRGKLRGKPVPAQQSDEQLSDISSGTRSLSHQGDDISLRSDSNISLASQMDVEVTSADQTVEISSACFQLGSQSPSGRAVNGTISDLEQKKSLCCLNKDVSALEITAVGPEQPSPISVLDASFYQDDYPPSPVTKSLNELKDYKSQSIDCCCDSTSLSDTLVPKLSTEFNHKKLENIENLLQKLQKLSSNGDEALTATDHIASLCETQIPDHRYVSEMLLASGLLMRDLSSGPTDPAPIQLHPSGHPINPDLFHVLEQTKSSWLPKPESIHDSTIRLKNDPEKLHRKLVFDVVNELLVQKVESSSWASQPEVLLRKKLAGRFPSGQCLLRELCSEIDQLKAESMMGGSCDDDNNTISGEEVLRRSEGWSDFGRQVPGVVLEIERSIFKDLVDEVMSGEAASSLRSKASRQHREQFA